MCTHGSARFLRRSVPILAVLAALSLGAVVNGDVAEAAETKGTASRTKLSTDVQQHLRSEAQTLLREHRIGVDYLQQNGFDLVLVLPSLEEMRDSMRELRKQGQLSEQELRAFEQRVESASAQERTKRSYVRTSPGFEPKTALPRPFKIATADGASVIMSEQFMQRFRVTTEYDLYRIVRNASIILTNFSGTVDEDSFGNHRARLMKTLDSNALLAGTPNSDARMRALLLFAASIVALDSIEPKGKVETTVDDMYVAAAVIGGRYQLF